VRNKLLIVLGCLLASVLFGGATVLFILKAAADDLDTVYDSHGNKLVLQNVPGEPTQHVEWVKSGRWAIGGDAVVSEALSRTITPARPPCEMSTDSNQFKTEDCSTMVVDVCTQMVSFKGFVQRDPGPEEVVGESIEGAMIAVQQRFGGYFVTTICNGKLVDQVAAGTQAASTPSAVAESAHASTPLELNEDTTGWSTREILGFKGAEPIDEVVAHASALGLVKAGDCGVRSDAREFTDCKFVSNSGEEMQTSLYRGQLQRIDYNFAAERYDEILELVKGSYGDPRVSPDSPDSADWGGGASESFSIDLGKTAVGNRGFLSFVLY